MHSIYQSKKTILGLSWNEIPGSFELVTCSFSEGRKDNQIEVLQFSPELGQFTTIASLRNMIYPFSKIKYAPAQAKNSELFATTGDALRLYQVEENAVQCVSKLFNNKKDETISPAPMTSFDWSQESPKNLLTCSVDTTCTLWDLETEQPKTQLIAHDKEVFDVCFSNSADCFASVGADGSLRMFDVRSLDHSTILFETPYFSDSNAMKSMIRLDWHHSNPNYISTFSQDSCTVHIIDIRHPGKTLANLCTPTGAIVTEMTWHPTSCNRIIISALDDIVYTWNNIHDKEDNTTPHSYFDITSHPFIYEKMQSEHSINALAWNPYSSQFLAYSYGSLLHILKV